MRDIVSPLSGIRSPFGQRRGISVRSLLFGVNEVGAWYDPSDLTTMFQDRAGTTPVTAAGQSVGLRLDKSKGLVLGPELRGTGVVSTTGSPGTLATFNTSTGAGSAYRLDGSNVSGVQVPVADGRTYLLDVEQLTGTLQIRGTGVAGNQLVTSVVGRQTYRLSVATGEDFFFVTGTNAASVTFTVHSVKELPGNHAVANSDAARGIYGIEPVGGRRNLFINSEALASHNTVRAAALNDQAVAPDGTTTADSLTETATTGDHRVDFTAVSVTSGVAYTFWTIAKANTRGWIRLLFSSGAFGTASANFNLSTGAVGTTAGVSATSVVDVGSGFYLVSATATATATTSATNSIQLGTGDNAISYAGDGTSGVFLWRWQFEAAASATNYQRVATQYDVTEAGKQTLHYVQYDGVDDGYVTPTITPNTDKVQVFAGVRKLSDAALGMISEYSADTNTNNGSWYLLAPTSAGVANSGFLSKGTIASGSSAANFAAPVSAVITGIGDISGDTSLQRRNGTQVSQGTADQGTGNFLAYPLYIGRRGGTTLPFNGRDYGLIVRFGPNLDANTISNVEKYLAQKTGVTL
jgi:hypothetical protein